MDNVSCLFIMLEKLKRELIVQLEQHSGRHGLQARQYLVVHPKYSPNQEIQRYLESDDVRIIADKINNNVYRSLPGMKVVRPEWGDVILASIDPKKGINQPWYFDDRYFQTALVGMDTNENRTVEPTLDDGIAMITECHAKKCDFYIWREFPDEDRKKQIVPEDFWSALYNGETVLFSPRLYIGTRRVDVREQLVNNCTIGNFPFIHASKRDEPGTFGVFTFFKHPILKRNCYIIVSCLSVVLGNEDQHTDVSYKAVRSNLERFYREEKDKNERVTYICTEDDDEFVYEWQQIPSTNKTATWFVTNTYPHVIFLRKSTLYIALAN